MSLTVLNNMLVDFDVRGQQGDGLLHWRKRTGIMDWCFGCNDRFVYYKQAAFCFTRCYLKTGVVWITCGLL